MTCCPICDTASPSPFLVRDPVSVHQNLLVDSPEVARTLNRGRLAMHACRACGLVFNAAFDPHLLQYGAAYDNTQSHSPAFAGHLEGLADHLTRAQHVRGVQVVEIGCGKGAFLRAIAERDPHTRGLGIDPSYVGPADALDGRVRFERRFFDDSCTDITADVIVCRHVIEHVSDPVHLLRLVRKALQAGGGRAFFETPCVAWILDHQVPWDFFYEHCSYFTAASLSTAFARAGMQVDSIRHVFGGQYLWAEARVADDAAELAWDEGRIAGLAAAFGGKEVSRIAALREAIERLAASGGVALWGAGAKGVTLAGLVDPSAALLSCVVDINPGKQGRYLPGTGHPIVAPEELRASGPRWAVMTNPNYMDESRRMLRAAGIRVELVDLMSDPATAVGVRRRAVAERDR